VHETFTRVCKRAILVETLGLGALLILTAADKKVFTQFVRNASGEPSTELNMYA